MDEREKVKRLDAFAKRLLVELRHKDKEIEEMDEALVSKDAEIENLRAKVAKHNEDSQNELKSVLCKHSEELVSYQEQIRDLQTLVLSLRGAEARSKRDKDQLATRLQVQSAENARLTSKLEALEAELQELKHVSCTSHTQTEEVHDNAGRQLAVSLPVGDMSGDWASEMHLAIATGKTVEVDPRVLNQIYAHVKAGMEETAADKAEIARLQADLAEVEAKAQSNLETAAEYARRTEEAESERDDAYAAAEKAASRQAEAESAAEEARDKLAHMKRRLEQVRDQGLSQSSGGSEKPLPASVTPAIRPISRGRSRVSGQPGTMTTGGAVSKTRLGPRPKSRPKPRQAAPAKPDMNFAFLGGVDQNELAVAGYEVPRPVDE
ncbi:Chromosome partition protein Smc [Carpediemonas membranifera]|uniref:Chromosome partition protein Smc n=1 Tax=Carpediemonas membranifera TaxID=201153 RepID=A0A8J6B1D4_9EUKA|nr:Chromosome partition protein Smc [Carpediemonas membranifera]|eukprot:KAG9396360.1 Chromosome partition protein Smc [Carpediemonas membranifera]